jgi:hypothetical protein
MPTEITVDVSERRKGLMRQRGPLFDEFERNPKELRLSVRIKAIDDEISECTEQLRQARLGETENVK